MDILVKTQATADINIVVPLTINNGTSAEIPDTGVSGTITVSAINPDGTVATFTAPNITEVFASSGVYKLTFLTSAATRLFTLANEANPYTLLIKSVTAGSAFYRAIRVYCVDRLPGEVAKSTEVATLPTLTAIEASTVLAKAATVATASSVAALPTLASIEASSVLAKESSVTARPTLETIEGSTVLAKETSITALRVVADAIPTLTEMEASTILAKEANLVLIKKLIKNKKTLTVNGGVYSLVVYDDNDIDEIMRKTVKDITGADITAIGAGVIARETKSSV